MASQVDPRTKSQASSNSGTTSSSHTLLLGVLADTWRSALELPRPVMVASFVTNLLGLALPIVILQVYDRVLVNQSLGTLAWLMIGLGVVIVLEAALKIMRSHLMSWAAAQAAFKADLLATSRILHAPAQSIKKASVDVWSERLDAQEQYNSFKSGNSRLTLIDLPFLFIYLTLTYLVAGPLVIAIVAVVALFAGYIYLKASALRTILVERGEHDRRRYGFLSEIFSFIGAAKSIAMEPLFQRRFERLQQSAAMTMFRKNLLANELNAASGLMTNIILITVVTVGAAMVIGGSLSVGALACSTMLTSRMIQPVVRGIPVWLEMQSAYLAKQRAQKLFELPALPSHSEAKLDDIGAGIHFANVTYTYPDAFVPAIDIPLLEISHGEMIGIKGDQSNGKSTLLNLLSGQLTPQVGRVHIGELDLAGPYKTEICRHMRYVGPEPDLFQGTVLENIIMFGSGAAVPAGRQAAQLIGLERDINRLPKGFDTPLKQGIGDTLPAGMLQQIAIARAIAGRPRVLLFDEANSRLDMRADAALREGLSRLDGHMTRIVVTNRPSLLAIASRVFELKSGRLIETSQTPAARTRAHVA